MILFSVCTAVTGQLLLKHGMNKIGFISVDMDHLPRLVGKALISPSILLGLTVFFIGALSWLVVLSRVELSWAQPIAAVSYVGVLFGSWFLFHEQVTTVRIAGVFVVVLGVILISRT